MSAWRRAGSVVEVDVAAVVVELRELVVAGVVAVLGVGFWLEVSREFAAVAIEGSPARPLCGCDSCGWLTGRLMG